jgi:hypothetical protein
MTGLALTGAGDNCGELRRAFDTKAKSVLSRFRVCRVASSSLFYRLRSRSPLLLPPINHREKAALVKAAG